VFQTGIETNRTLSKQTEKISKKLSLLGRPRSSYIFFSRFEPTQTETQSVSVVFQFVFLRNQKKMFLVCFGVSERYRNNQNKQNLWYEELKRLIF
jgi:hypothetical protein